MAEEGFEVFLEAEVGIEAADAERSKGGSARSAPLRTLTGTSVHQRGILGGDTADLD
jgi:hypothetical protein